MPLNTPRYIETPLLRRRIRGKNQVGLPFLPPTLIEKLQTHHAAENEFTPSDRSSHIGNCWLQTPPIDTIASMVNHYQKTGEKIPYAQINALAPVQRILRQNGYALAEGIWLLIYQYPHHYIRLTWKRGDAMEARLHSNVSGLSYQDVQHRCQARRIRRGSNTSRIQREVLGLDLHVLSRCANPFHLYSDNLPIPDMPKDYELAEEGIGATAFSTAPPRIRRHLRKILMKAANPSDAAQRYLKGILARGREDHDILYAAGEQLDDLLRDQILGPQQQFFNDTWMGTTEAIERLATLDEANRWLAYTSPARLDRYPQWFIDHYRKLADKAV